MKKTVLITNIILAIAIIIGDIFYITSADFSQKA